jgi:hypothetical protein
MLVWKLVTVPDATDTVRLISELRPGHHWLNIFALDSF